MPETCSPAPLRRRRSDASHCQTQAKLLAGRGDLHNARLSFQAQLPKPLPIDLPRRGRSVISRRVGMDVDFAEDSSRMHVAWTDNNPRQSTPVAKWNAQEDKLANRGEFEHHASKAIQPGDRIRSVNGRSASHMFAELEKASGTINLELSRNMADVLKPTSPQEQQSGLSTPDNSSSAASTPEKQRPLTASLSTPEQRPRTASFFSMPEHRPRTASLSTPEKHRSSCRPPKRPRSGLESAQSTRASTTASSTRSNSISSCTANISTTVEPCRSSSFSMLSHAGFVALFA